MNSNSAAILSVLTVLTVSVAAYNPPGAYPNAGDPNYKPHRNRVAHPDAARFKNRDPPGVYEHGVGGHGHRGHGGGGDGLPTPAVVSPQRTAATPVHIGSGGPVNSVSVNIPGAL